MADRPNFSTASGAGSEPWTVAIVGGGAAGFFAAIATAEANPQQRVLLLEAGSQPLTKVRISGGGRCNVTHHCFDPLQLVQHYPRGGKALRGAFSRFQPQDTVAWFQGRGVSLKTEADGRMFPVTDRSETIIECLETAAAAAGVVLWQRAPVVAVNKPEGGPFQLRLKSGELVQADRLLLATGSSPQGYRLAQSLGHQIIAPVPSLFTLQVRDRALQQRAGVSIPQARVRLMLGQKPLEQTGPVLITHWGFSGPAILRLSAWGARLLHEAQYQAELQIQWLPALNRETVLQRLRDSKDHQARKQLRTAQPDWSLATPPASPSPRSPHLAPHLSPPTPPELPQKLPQRLWEYLLERSALDPAQRWADLSKAGMQQLATELTQGCYQIQGKGVFKEEFVTCGGVSLKEVNFKTLESRCCGGLYFAGEILDVDGVTGGFNFQNAWTTAWLAAQAIGLARSG
ncbi:MAG: NAD(P)/FAD-dependent oxidoreductase [Prochlorothrix sp.]